MKKSVSYKSLIMQVVNFTKNLKKRFNFYNFVKFMEIFVHVYHVLQHLCDYAAG